MRKILLIVLSVILILAMSACGNSENTTVTEESELVNMPINPVTDYVGPYVNQENGNCTMMLSAGEDNTAFITIDIQTTNHTIQWNITGDYEEGVITYKEAEKISDGTEENITTTGSFEIGEDYVITWKEETNSNDITFVYNSEDHE